MEGANDFGPVARGPESAIESLLVVQSLAERLSMAEHVDDVAEAVVSGIQDVLDPSALVLALVDAEFTRLVPLATRGLAATSHSLVYEPTVLQPGQPAYAVLTTGEPVFWSSTAERDRCFPGYSSYPTEHASWAILPLLARDSGIGVLALGWHGSRAFPPSEAVLLGVVAHQCAVALDRVKLLESEREQREFSDLLAEGTRVMVSALDPDEIVLRLVRLAVPKLAPWCSVYAADGDVLTPVALEAAESGCPASKLSDLASVPMNASSPLALAYRTGKVQLTAEVPSEVANSICRGRLASRPTAPERSGNVSALMVPVKTAGRVLGVMSLVSDTWEGSPGFQELRAAEGLAGRAGVALHIADQFRKEHEAAVALTQAVLPTKAYSIPSFDTASCYLPAGAAVAGDWFDVVPVGPERYLVGVGDAAGHGIEAASLMAELRNAARGLAIAGKTPAAILRGLSWLVAETQPDGFATALYAVVEPGNDTLTWSSAGHLPPIRFDANGARMLATSGATPLGMQCGRNPVDRELRLGEHEGLVIFTDGVVERRKADLDRRLDQLLNLVSTNRRQPAEILVRVIVEALCAEREDDCCLLVIRRLTEVPSRTRG